MAQPDQRDNIANRLLLALPQATLQRMASALEPVELTRGQVIDHVDAYIEHLYFVNRGIISLVKTMHDGRTVEIGAVGIEGMTTPSALFGLDQAAIESIVQLPGAAFRLKRDMLRAEMARDEATRTVMQKYARFAIGALAQTAACNRLHSLEARCCRWLLIAHDSARSDSFELTHEFLAMMLGVQRAGVSIVASLLRKSGLIQYTRGRVTIAYREGLEEAACECYGAMRTELDKIFRGNGTFTAQRERAD